MNKPRFEIRLTPLGFVVRIVHPDFPKHSWESRPWREHRSALQAIYLVTGHAPIPAPAGSGWHRAVQFDPHGLVEIREVADEMPVRVAVKRGRPTRAVYQSTSIEEPA